jgi:hypothetical protein
VDLFYAIHLVRSVIKMLTAAAKKVIGGWEL